MYSEGGITRNRWGVGRGPLSDILKTREHNVSETGRVSVLRCGDGDAAFVWGRNRISGSLVHLKTETNPVSEPCYAF